MINQAVIGLGFGDEGKGTTTAYLCSQAENPIVVRHSGGHQAGHTVVHGDKRHVFASFGSGTLQGVPTYWSPMCTVYPTAFLNEYEILREKGIEPKISINKKCPVTTPFDIMKNHKNEAENDHGSCGVGFGATLEREEKYYSLLFEDLFCDSVLRIKLQAIMDFYGVVNYPKQSLDCFILDCKRMMVLAGLSSGCPSVYDKYIYEGSQGLMLDKNIGFFPHVTRASLGNMTYGKELFLVTRAYQTRHGNGPMTNEDIPHKIKINPDETNQTNKHQGKLRVSLLDIELLRYVLLKKNYFAGNQKNLVITCLDHVETDYRFTVNNRILSFDTQKDFVGAISEFLGIESVYISTSDKFENIRKFDWEE